MEKNEGLKLNLTLIDLDASESSLAAVSRELLRRLNQEHGIEATQSEQGSTPGSRGLTVDYSTILLALISSHGVLMSLTNVLKSFVDRKQSLKVELNRSDGNKLVIDAEGLSKSDFEGLLSQVREFLESK